MLNSDEHQTFVQDISGLKIPWIKTFNQLNNVEAENILRAFSKFFSQKRKDPKKWLSSTFVKKLHLTMFNKVWDWAGKYRTTSTNLGIKPYLISFEVMRLCEDIHNIFTKSTFLEQSAIIHHRLVQIHPFINGNGRHVRFLSDYFLFSYYDIPTNWPIDLVMDRQNRKDYIKALKAADLGNYNELIKYMIKHGAKNPTTKQLLQYPFFKKNLSQKEMSTSRDLLLEFNKKFLC